MHGLWKGSSRLNDLIALKAMTDQAYWVKYSATLFKLENLQKEIRLILNAARDYYSKYPDKKSISCDELMVFFKHLNPALQNWDLYQALFDKLMSIQVDNDELVVDVLNGMVARHVAAQIGVVATQIVQEAVPADAGLEKLHGHLQQYKDIVGEVQDSECEVCTIPLSGLFSAAAEAEGLPLRMQYMRQALGAFTGATLGHIFARPDCGKTSFALNLACGFAHHLYSSQLGGCVLYLQNEEDIKRVKSRAVCAMYQRTPEQIMEELEHFETAWAINYEPRLKLIPSVTDISQVEHYIQRFKPSVVFIDQGPKVSFPLANKNANGVEKLQKLYNRFRELAKEYGPDIITLGQADNNAHNKKFLGLNNLDQSKVAIQGELDWCIGIGFLDEPGYESVRYLSMVKNKLKGIYPKDQVIFDVPACKWKG